MDSRGIEIVEFHQDVDSFGWAILVLFRSECVPMAGWGVLDITAPTEAGEGYPNEKGVKKDQVDVVRAEAKLVDWYDSEASARLAYRVALSRRW